MGSGAPLNSDAASALLARRVKEAEAAFERDEQKDANLSALNTSLEQIDQILEDCRAPAVVQPTYQGDVLFLPCHVKEIAEAAKLPIPPESRWMDLARGLSRAFYVSLAQREEDRAAAIGRSGVFGEIATRARELLTLLDVQIDRQLPDRVDPHAVFLTFSGVTLYLARRIDTDMFASTLCGLKAIVTAAEKVKVKRGPYPNNFARRLLEELALQYRDAFGSWPVLKDRKERNRDTPTAAARWVRKVCQHATPRLPAGLHTLAWCQNALAIELARLNRWKSGTLAKEFEDAIGRAKRR